MSNNEEMAGMLINLLWIVNYHTFIGCVSHENQLINLNFQNILFHNVPPVLTLCYVSKCCAIMKLLFCIVSSCIVF